MVTYGVLMGTLMGLMSTLRSLLGVLMSLLYGLMMGLLGTLMSLLYGLLLLPPFLLALLLPIYTHTVSPILVVRICVTTQVHQATGKG